MQTFYASRRKAKHRLVALSLLAFFGFIGAVLITVYEDALHEEVQEDTDIALSRLAGHSRSILLNEISQYRDNLFFLHATPPISGLTRASANNGTDPFDGTRFEQWKLRLETIFVSMLQNNQEIDQLRIILTNDTGRELIRVDRLSGRIEVIPTQRMQDKADRDYFQTSAKLSPGELYLSRINPNEEFGQIQYPIRPTLRLATPIFGADNKRFGFLIMNINAQALLDNLREETGGPFEIILTDNDGFYIDHPLPEFRFSRDVAPDHNWRTNYTVSGLHPETSGIATEIQTGISFPYYHTTLQFAPDPSSIIHLYATAPAEWVSDQIQARRVATYGFGLLGLLILFVTLGLFMRSYRSSLRLSEARAEHEAIINGSSAAIIGMELDGRVTSCNDAGLDLLHMSRRAIIGKNITKQPIFGEIDFSKEITKVRTQKSSSSLECKFINSQDQEIDLTVTFSPILLENRQLAGIALITRDITREKAAERSILRANAELESEVEKRTEELADAHRKAMHASEMKSTFISNVSHEMRTPLNGLIGSINLIKRQPLSDIQSKYLEMAETSSATLATLINDILDLSKIEAGKLDFEHNPFNPVAVLEAVAQSASIRAQEKKIDLILDTTKLEYDRVWGDANRLKQILNNLISNAIKFTSQGYVAISANSSVVGNHLRLDVQIEDTGIGITAENKHKLFAAFSQENNEISANFGGTGLGLSISKQLCQQMNGDIGFVSEKGSGSTFFFHLLFDLETAQRHSLPQVLSGKNVTIRMAQAKTTEFANRIVRLLGGTVPDAAPALNGAGNAPSPDFIITDYPTGRLKKLCASFEQSDDEQNALPVVLLVKGLDVKRPEYRGTVELLTSPLTLSGLIARIPGPMESPDLGEPSSSGSGSTDRSEEQMPHPSLDKFNIVVVDDNDINLAVAQGFLAVTKVNIRTAHNGIEAIELLQKMSDDGQEIHCILMDCQMPVMDGYETTNIIRSGKASAGLIDIPIIAMTANAMSGEREKCLAVGMSDYITKPIQPNILIDRVQHWVDYRARQMTEDEA